MQAVVLFVMFGLITSVMGAIIVSISNGAIQIKEQQIESTKQYFRDIEFLFNKVIVTEQMAMPVIVPAKDYLIQPSIKKLANLTWGTLQQDPWKSDYLVEVGTTNTLIANGVTVPITAFLLVSLGPDRVIDPDLQAEITALPSPASVRDIMRIEQKIAALNGSSDDIVYTFNTRTAIGKRWLAVEDRLQRIGSILLQDFAQKRLRGEPEIFANVNDAGLGLKEYIDYITLEAGIALTSTLVTNDFLTLTLTNIDATPPWTVNYNLDLEG